MEKGVMQVVKGIGIQYLPDFEGTDKTIGALSLHLSDHCY